ncbi:S8 family serine peptidase [Rhodanobacter sp. MP7CTX1]|uniref:S8 family serine peptidase n=1 Tax=Rhodanobacter sp. MP7CTX1 TaxID=2723084 RepID=UPI0017F71602|nr:S8 family serine peptidase [Rhodanobacter sp. MP7CTX1]MBB6188533.1 serine protease [Rhodanobacter sp. MP7CTX1]
MMNSSGIKSVLVASIGMALSSSAFAGSITQAIPTPSVAAANFNVSSLRTDGSYDRFIIRYRVGSTEQGSQTAAVQNISAAAARARLGNAPRVNYKRKLATGAELVTTSRKLNQAEAAAFIQSIAADPAVEHVAPDVLRQAVLDTNSPNAITTAFMPNDPNFATYQTDYLAGNGAPTAKNKVANYGGVNIVGAWNLADGKGATIAVLDTGIVKHADVNTSMADAGYDFTSDALVSGRTSAGRAPGGWDLGDWTTGDRYTTTNGGCINPGSGGHDSSWHGTHVASASGAELTNNGVGMAGIAYNAKVIPVRVLGHCGGTDSDIDDAIVWAAGGHVEGIPDNPNPAQVINLSLGGPSTCTAKDDPAIAIAKANALGAVVVVAAGNSGEDVVGSSPASCPGAITVASTGVTSKLAYYSNYNGPKESIVALSAFGGGVNVNDGESGTQLNPEGFAWQALNNSATAPAASPGGDTYGGMAGTSQAAPHVTGAVALMQSARVGAGLPLLTPAQVLSILKSTARVPKVTPDPSKTFGAGILDAGAAVAAAATFGTDVPPPPVPDSSTVLTSGIMVAGQSGSVGASTVYKLDVPAGALALTLRTLGGSGNVSLYVKVGSVGSATNYDFKSASSSGTSKSVAISRPRVASYYVTLVGDSAYSGVTVLGTFTAPK